MFIKTNHDVNRFIRRSQGRDGVGCGKSLRISGVMEYRAREAQAARKVYPPVPV